MPLLSQERRVIALDVAGFGKTPPLAGEQTVDNLTASFRDTLRDLGIHEPVDLVGNSMGGFIALEAAKLGLARSVVGLSPGGLWKEGGGIARHVVPTLKATRWVASKYPRLAEQAMHVAPIRALFMAIPISINAWNMPAEDAVACSQALVAATSFDEVLKQVPCFVGGRDLTVPVTIAFGSRDWLLTRGSQQRDHLPDHARWLRPKGWGHVPMWDDPEGVAKLILEATT